MWKNGIVKITELQNKQKKWDTDDNKKNKEAREKFYACVGIHQLDQTVVEN